jgi:hypothetical protein
MNSRNEMAGAGSSSAAGTSSGPGPPAKKQKSKGTFVSKPVPPPTKNVKQTLNDLHPDGTHAHGEDGTYVDRRGARPYERFTVLGGLLFPLLAAMQLPRALKDRVDGALYPTADKLRCGIWSSKGGKLNLLCAHCVYMGCSKVSRAHYPLEEGGDKTVCAECRDAAGAAKTLANPCTNCGQKEAHHPSEPGKKDKRLCPDCAKDAGTHAPRNRKYCYCSDPKRFDRCFICCPSDKLCAEMCHCCREKQVKWDKYRLGERFCADCRVMNPEEKKIRIEHFVRQLILAFLKFTPTATDNLLLGSGPNRANCAGLMDQRRRPDILFVHPHCFVDMEIDENCHEDRCPMYDVQKVVDTTAAVRNDEALKTRKAPFPGLFIRLNPDAYNRRLVHLKDRVVAVCEKVKEWVARVEAATPRLLELEAGAEETPADAWLRQVTVVYAFYHSKMDARVAEHKAEFAKLADSAVVVEEIQ